MATRLNKAIIAEIIDSVIASTTFKQQREALEKEIHAHASAMLRRDAPPGLVDLSKAVPREWLRWTDIVWLSGHDWNPSHILRTAFEPCKGRYSSGHLHVEPSAPTTANYRAELNEEDFVELTKRATELAEAYRRTRQQLTAVLTASRTVEKALERMPELAPHIPKIAKPYPLVTTSNLLADLTAFGFDMKNPA